MCHRPIRTRTTPAYASTEDYIYKQTAAIDADFKKERDASDVFEDGDAKFKAWVVAKLDRGSRSEYVLKVKLGKDAGKFPCDRICKVAKLVGSRMTKPYNAERKEPITGSQREWRVCAEFHVCDQSSHFWNANNESAPSNHNNDYSDDNSERASSMLDWN